MEIYRVGGAVRDQLLGRSIQEQDFVVVGASPALLLSQGFKPVGKDFPVFLHPVTHEEYALARTERKQGPGYKGFSCYAAPDVSLEADLKRRDLTINAMAETATGEIIDPYGGQQDLQGKILRHVSPAFSEDPVRILRVARFMARFSELGFKVAAETMQLMIEMVRSGEVDALVAERVWHEFTTALAEPRPQAFIETLRACGALRIICPELDCLFGQQGICARGLAVDLGEHALTALMEATHLTSEPMIRFAALMLRVEPMQRIVKRWGLPVNYRTLLLLAARYYQCTHRLFALSTAEIITLLEQLDAFRRPERVKAFLTVCEADWRSSADKQKYPQSYPQRQHFLAVLKSAHQVAIKPLLQAGFQGQQLGQQLHQARIEALKQLHPQ